MPTRPTPPVPTRQGAHETNRPIPPHLIKAARPKPRDGTRHRPTSRGPRTRQRPPWLRARREAPHGTTLALRCRPTAPPRTAGPERRPSKPHRGGSGSSRYAHEHPSALDRLQVLLYMRCLLDEVSMGRSRCFHAAGQGHRPHWHAPSKDLALGIAGASKGL